MKYFNSVGRYPHVLDAIKYSINIGSRLLDILINILVRFVILEIPESLSYIIWLKWE